MPGFVAGLDLGSTSMKILILDGAGAEVVLEEVPTPWINGADGATEIVGTDVAKAVTSLLAAAADALPAGETVEALAVSGMGETGFVVDEKGSPLAPGFAWFDPRGQSQVDAFPAELRAQFAGRTGLPWGVQVSAAKLALLRDTGVDLARGQWMNLPEWVIERLGGRRVAEYSLASRTGLLDQSTGRAWPELLAYLGVDDAFMPELVDAGTPLGSAQGPGVPDAFSGARLTVAGHDHLVSAVSGGAGQDAYHVSMGTAEVLLRVLDSPLTFGARRRLGDALINTVRHVVPGQYVLVAGVKSGLVMRRVLQLLGVSDRAGRDDLDARVAALATSRLPRGSLEVSGARNDDGVFRLVARGDGLSPEELFLAALEHGNAELRLLTDAMDREVQPPRSSLLTGGWASMRCVVDARSRVLPDVRTTNRSQETAHGAALFARDLTTTNQEHTT